MMIISVMTNQSARMATKSEYKIFIKFGFIDIDKNGNPLIVTHLLVEYANNFLVKLIGLLGRGGRV